MAIHRFTEMIPAYVLDALDKTERARMEKHLQTCRACARAIAEYGIVTDLMPHAAPPLAPPARLRARVLAATVGEPKPAFNFGEWLVGVLRAPAFAAATLGVAVIAIIQVFLLQNQVAQQATILAQQREIMIAMAYADSQPLHLSGAEAAPRAEGRVHRYEDTAVVFVQQMPALASNQVYQFWFIDSDGDRASGGTFTVDAQGRGWLMAQAPDSVKGYAGVGITIEPAGGSPKPTGAKILGASF